MTREDPELTSTDAVVGLAGQIWEALRRLEQLQESYRPKSELEATLNRGYSELRAVALTIVGMESRIAASCLPIVVLARSLCDLVPTTPDLSFLHRFSSGMLLPLLRKADTAKTQWKSARASAAASADCPDHQPVRPTANQLLVLEILASAASPLVQKQLLEAASQRGMRGRDAQRMNAESFRVHIVKWLKDHDLVKDLKKQGSGLVITNLGREALSAIQADPM